MSGRVPGEQAGAGRCHVEGAAVGGVIGRGAETDNALATSAPTTRLERAEEPAATLTAAVTGLPATTNEPPESIIVDRAGFTVFDGFGAERLAVAAALVTNRGDQPITHLTVTFNFLEPGGAPVATEAQFVEVLPAGADLPVVVEVLTDLSGREPSSVEVSALPGSDFVRLNGEMLTIADLEMVPAEDGGFDLRGNATNPLDEPVSYSQISCLASADGEVVGGLNVYPDAMAAGQTVVFEATSFDGKTAAMLAAGANGVECGGVVSLP